MCIRRFCSVFFIKMIRRQCCLFLRFISDDLIINLIISLWCKKFKCPASLLFQCFQCTFQNVLIQTVSQLFHWNIINILSIFMKCYCFILKCFRYFLLRFFHSKLRYIQPVHTHFPSQCDSIHMMYVSSQTDSRCHDHHDTYYKNHFQLLSI